MTVTRPQRFGAAGINLTFNDIFMMKITSTNGEIVTISRKEIIWNALDLIKSYGCGDDEVYLCLQPRRPGICVRRAELRKAINEFIANFA